jgi:16S rRNA processing protein RimM
VSKRHHVEVGRLGAAHGVRGWLRVQSFTDPPRRLFEWQSWQLRAQENGATRDAKLLEARQQGNGWIVRIEGVDDRDAASRLTGQTILIERELMGPAGEREHYRDDLVGFEARNVKGAVLGVVDHFVDTPGNAVMVIKGAREHLVPVTKQHLRSIDGDARSIVVDWPEDF